MNKFIQLAAAGVCGIVLGLGISQPAAAQTFVKCDNYVNMHAQPYSQSTFVGQIPNNSMVETLDEKQGWVQIKSGNITGWINQKFLYKAQPFELGYTVAIIHPEKLSVYIKPNKESTIYTTVYQNQEIECVNYQGNWLTLAFEDGSYGFIDAYEAELKTYSNTAKCTLQEQEPILIQQNNQDQLDNKQQNYEESNNNEQEEYNNEQSYEELNNIEDNNKQEELNEDEWEEYEELNEDEDEEEDEQEEEYEDEQENYEELNEEQNNINEDEQENYEELDEKDDFENNYQSNNNDITDYANQFVGNPYKWGGNSLTDGIDCSHFVHQVLTNTGHYDGQYVTSDDWAEKGNEVSSLDDAVSGDVIVYSGHVAIYDGEGGIVEAKGSDYGITHDRDADCKEIVSIRHFD